MLLVLLINWPTVMGSAGGRLGFLKDFQDEAFAIAAAACWMPRPTNSIRLE